MKKVSLMIVGVIVALGIYIGFSHLVSLFAPDVTSSFKASEEAYKSWFPALAVAREGQRFIIANTGAIFLSTIFLGGWWYWLIKPKTQGEER